MKKSIPWKNPESQRTAFDKENELKTVTTLSLLFLMMLLIPVTGVALPSGDGDDAKTVESDSAIKGCRAYIAEQTAAGRIKKDTPGWKSRLPKFPRVTFQEQATYVWKLKTNHGEIEIEFLPKVAPNHVANYKIGRAHG